MANFKSFINEKVLDNPNLSIMFIGDIMQHEMQLKKAWNGEEYDYKKFFKYIKKDLKSVDFCVGNLETVFGGGLPSGTEPFNSPDKLAYNLINSGVNCLVTANNHSTDMGTQGVARTIDVLDRYGIRHTGTFKSNENISPLFLEKNGITVSILNYTYGVENMRQPKPHVVNFIGDESDIPEFDLHPKNINFKKIGLDINGAKKNSDKVVVFFHWGDQYKIEPNENQVSLKEFCFLKGADIVIGAHPHVVQPSFWDKKNDTYVAYSLGNFMAYQSLPNTSKGMVVKINIGKDKIESVDENLITTRLYPINLTPYMEYINKFSQAVKDTHVKNKIGDIDVFFPIKETNKPTKLITSGLQGDEPAGPIALLKWVESNKSPSNIIFIPIVSAESYLNKTHFDNSDLNVNHKIPYDPTYEMEKLVNSNELKKMCSGGFLACHEDPYRDESYLLVWKNNDKLVESLLEILNDNFKIRSDSDDGVRRTHDMKLKESETLGNYCAKLGAPFSIATETPVINTNINKRVDAQVSMITEFVEYNGTV